MFLVLRRCPACLASCLPGAPTPFLGEGRRRDLLAVPESRPPKGIPVCCSEECMRGQSHRLCCVVVALWLVRASTTQRRGVLVQYNQGPFGCDRHAASPSRPVRKSPRIDGRCIGSSTSRRCGGPGAAGLAFGSAARGGLTCGSSVSPSRGSA